MVNPQCSWLCPSAGPEEGWGELNTRRQVAREPRGHVQITAQGCMELGGRCAHRQHLGLRTAGACSETASGSWRRECQAHTQALLWGLVEAALQLPLCSPRRGRVALCLARSSVRLGDLGQFPGLPQTFSLSLAKSDPLLLSRVSRPMGPCSQHPGSHNGAVATREPRSPDSSLL